MISSKQKIALLAVLVAMAAVLAIFVGGERNSRSTFSPSSYSTHPGGYKALYQLLEELHLPVSRLRRPYSVLELHQGALIVVDPHPVPFSKREVAKLKKWIEKGNRLIILHGGPRYIPKAISSWISGNEAGDGKSVHEYSLAHQLGLRVGKNSSDSRKTLDVASLRLYGVKEISISSDSRWKRVPKKWEDLLRDEFGPVIVSRKWGKGEEVAISDATIACNRDVAKADNVKVVPALLLEQGRPKEIMFDEYHHGFARAESFWGYAASSVLAWILLQVGIGCALFFLSRRGSLAGRYRPLFQPVGRSSMEYVDSMANLLESTKAGSVALDAILRRFLLHLSRQSGMPLKRLEEDPAGQIATWGPEGIDQKRLVEECRQSIKRGEDTQYSLALARRLARTRAVLFQVRPHKAAMPERTP
jgi:hypothetical protein